MSGHDPGNDQLHVGVPAKEATWRRASDPGISRRRFLGLLAAGSGAAVATSSAWVAGSTPKYGGILNAGHFEDPPSLSLHEDITVSTVWAAMPCYSNLVLFNPLRGRESRATIQSELAENWAWRDEGKSLIFSLRRGVRWHDGRPLTSTDVKYTFNLVRGAPGTSGLRLNPRKAWYGQIRTIDTPDPYTVVFRLKRVQPSLLTMLAAGQSPVYPAHVPVPELRTRCVGTGPFKLKQYRPGEIIELVRNPDYFIKDRPYLDGIRFIIIKDSGTRKAALQAGRLDVDRPGTGGPIFAETLKNAVPGMVIAKVPTGFADSLLINVKRPPFNDPGLRRAISLAIDRRAYLQAVRQGAAIVGASMLPPPWGLWGLGPDDLATLPGSGDTAMQKAEARRLLHEAGFDPGHPLRLVVTTRDLGGNDGANFVMDQLKQVGVEPTLEPVESTAYFARLARREYGLAADQAAVPVDDPDVAFYGRYVCGSPANFMQYCEPAVDRMIDEQSQTIEQVARRRIVAEIQKKLALDGANPTLGWTIDYFAVWPYVKNLIPHQSVYNYARFQDVWLDR